MTTKMRRRGEPSAPERLSDGELETARPDHVEDRLRAHERWAERLEGRDPGAGLPPAKAEPARKAQLAELEAHTAEVQRLRGWLDVTAPERIARQTFAERLLSKARRQAIAEAHDDESNAFLRQQHVALAAREREREAKRKLRDSAEHRKHPPHPQAQSILAAVAADPILLDCLEHKLRPVEGQDGQTATSVLDAHDVGILLVTLRLLAERNPLVFQGWATSLRWPERNPHIAPVENLRESLRELRRLGFLEIRVSGDMASVTYGERTRAIARKWSIDLDEPEAKEAVTTTTT